LVQNERKIATARQDRQIGASLNLLDIYQKFAGGGVALGPKHDVQKSDCQKRDGDLPHEALAAS
jgi:hypothetical protein